MRLTVELDRAAALHLAHALRAHRTYCDRAGYALPFVLDVLARDAELIAHGGQIRPFRRGGAETDSHDDDEAPAVLTRYAFARACGRSERTVRRWVREGRVVEGIPASELRRVRKDT